MDPKVAYWTGALVNMAVIVALATRGVRLARRGEVAAHRRHMLAAVALVLGFLGSYVLKLAFLGRESLSEWGATSLWMLRLHETCVLVMVVAGGLALHRGLRLRHTRLVTRAAADPAAPPRMLGVHRAAGRTAVVAAVIGLLSAAFVLAGMYQRAALVALAVGPWR